MRTSATSQAEQKRRCWGVGREVGGRQGEAGGRVGMSRWSSASSDAGRPPFIFTPPQ